MKKDKLRCMYNNAISQTFSASGKFIFIGNTFGDIFVHGIDDILSAERTNCDESQSQIHPQGRGSISSLSFHRDFLIVGSKGVVYGLPWDEEERKLQSSHSWEIKIPDSPYVNYLLLNKESDEVHAGCDDGNVYLLSLEDGKIVREYKKHTDLVHCLASCDGRLYSAAHDGSVLIWEENEKEPVGKVEPHTKDHLSRSEFGKFIGSCAVSNDWLICGGGPKLSLWHLRSMECTQDFDFAGKIHCCDFVDDQIFVAGVHQAVQSYTFNGELTTNIPVENTSVYSFIWQMKPRKFMSLAGYSNQLRILTDFRYVDNSVDLYPELVPVVDLYKDE